MKLQLRYFRSLALLTSLIEEYFKGVGIDTIAIKIKNGKESPTNQPLKSKSVNKRAVKPHYEPPTITGLALHLGFNSLDEFEQYEKHGKYANLLKRARLIIAAAYEKKLHNTHHGGAVFALKELGWNERADDKAYLENAPVITIKIIESGPAPAATEKEIPL